MGGTTTGIADAGPLRSGVGDERVAAGGLLIQAVGRALRRHEGKSEVIVHDYVHAYVPVLNAQYSKRR